MPYILDENDNHIKDENGNKIEFIVEHIDGELYKHKEPLHINIDGHLDTEDRNIVIKEAISPFHAVCKKQLDEVNDSKYSKNEIDKILTEFKNTIDLSLKAQEAKILTQMINFRNNKIQNRLMRKKGVIPKIVNEVHPIITINDISENTKSLNEIYINAIYIQRRNWYFHSKSALVEASFKDSVEFMFDSKMTKYNIYFTHFNKFWSYKYIVEYIILPKAISIDNENINNIINNENDNENINNNINNDNENIINNENI